MYENISKLKFTRSPSLKLFKSSPPQTETSDPELLSADQPFSNKTGLPPWYLVQQSLSVFNDNRDIS